MVLAEWHSGEIRIHHGKLMKSVHQGYASLYEKELFFKIKKGIVLDQYEIDNTRFYNDKAGMKEQNMNDLREAIFEGKLKKRKIGFRRMLEKVCDLFERK